MQTVDNIVKKIEELKNAQFVDFFGAQKADLIEFLSYEYAKPYLKEDVTEEQWQPPTLTEENVVNCMQEYMSFALDKAENHRGLSASRSIDHYKAWLWLLEDDVMLEFIEDDMNYMNYGVPILRAICTKYGFEFPTNSIELVNMSNGRPCCEDCDMGCAE